MVGVDGEGVVWDKYEIQRMKKRHKEIAAICLCFFICRRTGAE